MIFSYHDIEIRSLCEKGEYAVEKLGVRIATIFQDRLADLQALEYVSDIFMGNPQPYGDDNLKYKVDVFENYKIIFCCGHIEIPKNSIGQIDWSNVSRIQIIKLETNDYDN